MKRIRTLPVPTPGLANYLAQSIVRSDWGDFRSNYQKAYRELRNTLVELQHGLCGYCEIDLIEHDIQVEHVIPQSDPKSGAAQALNHANLIACCRGGAANEFASDGLDDAARFGDRSCGQAKDRNNTPDFIDPRNLPDLPSLLQVQPDGIVIANATACAASAIAEEKIQKTIDILQLNVERLRQARENRWNDLKQLWDSYIADDEVIQAAVREDLLLNSAYVLPRFFTTSRSYFMSFGVLGECVLAEPPQAWI